MQLIAAANSSAGASQKQYEKTLESMETALARLKNAWNEFTMGLANNTILKGVIDLLTTFINVVNGLVDTLSFGNGAIKSFLSLMTGLAGLNLGSVILKSAMVSFSAAGIAAGTTFGSEFKRGFATKLDKFKEFG